MSTSVLKQNRADRSEVLKTAEAPSTEAVKKTEKSGKKPSKKIVIVLVLILAVGGFLGYKKMMPAKPAPPAPGDVVPIDPTTLNLAGGHYLKIAISVELVAGKASATDFSTSHAAQLLIEEFSDRTVGSLSSNPARDKLTKELTGRIKKAYSGEVYDVYLTQFVTQ
jgi:flagellar protein FliL